MIVRAVSGRARLGREHKSFVFTEDIGLIEPEIAQNSRSDPLVWVEAHNLSEGTREETKPEQRKEARVEGRA